MKQVTLSDIRKFILSRDDDEPVNLLNGGPHDEPRCVLGEYCFQRKIAFGHASFIGVFSSMHRAIRQETEPDVLDVIDTPRDKNLLGILELFKEGVPTGFAKNTTYGVLKTFLKP